MEIKKFLYYIESMWAIADACLAIGLLAFIMSCILGGYRVARNKMINVEQMITSVNDILDNKIPSICDVKPRHEEGSEIFTYKIDKPGPTLIDDIKLVLHCMKISKIRIEQFGGNVTISALQNQDTALQIKAQLSKAGIRLDCAMQVIAYENPGLWV